MAALSTFRDTPAYSGAPSPVNFAAPLAAAVKLYQGAMVAINQAGNLVAASADSTLRVLGVLDGPAGGSGGNVDNLLGAAGALIGNVKRGVFRFDNSSGVGAVVDDDVGRPCYVVFDNQVSRVSLYGVRPTAGRVYAVDSTGVWVEFGDLPNLNGDGNIDLMMIAGSDLSAAQYLAVALASDGEVDLVGAAGALITGILQNAPVASAVAIVRVAGVTKWIPVTTTAVGAMLAASTTTGKAKAAVVSDASAVGSNVFGISITAGVTDTSSMQVLIARMGLVPATAA